MTTRRSVLAAIAAAIALPPAAHAELGFALTELAPGIHVHIPKPALVARTNQGDIANLGVVVGADACLVVDTGGSPAVGRKLRAAIAAITNKPIRYIVNTHTHPDHLFGNQAFLTDSPVFVGHHNLPRALASRQEHYLSSFREQLGSELMDGFEFIMPTLLIETETVIDLGGRKIVLTAWPPAHTDCDLTVFDEGTSTLFTGDLVFRRHVPVLDGSLIGWLKVMDGLTSYRALRAVPGHGQPDSDWPRSLDMQRAYFQALANDIREDIKLGVTLREAIETAASGEGGKWDLFGEYNGRNVSQAYRELEWE